MTIDPWGGMNRGINLMGDVARMESHRRAQQNDDIYRQNLMETNQRAQRHDEEYKKSLLEIHKNELNIREREREQRLESTRHERAISADKFAYDKIKDMPEGEERQKAYEQYYLQGYGEIDGKGPQIIPRYMKTPEGGMALAIGDNLTIEGADSKTIELIKEKMTDPDFFKDPKKLLEFSAQLTPEQRERLKIKIGDKMDLQIEKVGEGDALVRIYRTKDGGVKKEEIYKNEKTATPKSGDDKSKEAKAALKEIEDRIDYAEKEASKARRQVDQYVSIGDDAAEAEAKKWEEEAARLRKELDSAGGKSTNVLGGGKKLDTTDPLGIRKK